ncbi:MAG: single-stranded-DNA-specific exonuclease RecJ [Planctomycetaceae bacterium]
MSGTLGVSPLVAQVLLARGYGTTDEARAFLDPKLTNLHDPELLPGVADAADRIVSALRAGRRITVYGDYDVDGVTATSLLWHCLKLAGANVDYYIPCRMEEGYGLNCEAIRQLHAEDPRRLLVSVDCGICSVEEAALAKQLGLELIVTDHHQMDAELPNADCLVHPRLPGSEYPFGELCGVGVAFKLAWAVCQRLGDGRKASPHMREFLLSAVGLTAIGTIADAVPLRGENRVLVRFGLGSLVHRASPGLKALMQTAKLNGNGTLRADNVAYALAPRINAAGRLGQARLAVELLTTDDEHRAAQLAAYLERLNLDRRTVERRMMKQAKELIAKHPAWNEQPALVLAHSDWHAGVIGIVASRVAEQFQKPAVLISLNDATRTGQGSARSFAGFDLHAALSACSEHLISCGGHQAAAGLRIDTGKIDTFREAFCRYALENHSVTDRDLELRVDAEIRFADLTLRAVHELDRLGPFGQQNLSPVFAATRVELAGPPRKIGEGENHLLLRVRQFGTTMKAVAFGRSGWADEMAQTDGPLSLCFSAGINEWQGRKSVELFLEDWQPDGNP